MNRMVLLVFSLPAVLLGLLGEAAFAAEQGDVPDYAASVAPIFQKYCAGCHNDGDREGDFSLESYASLQKGTADGPALLAGDSANSRIVRLMTGEAEPAMPPEGEPRPTEQEIARIKAWIDAGAKGPDGAAPNPLALIVPKIPSRADTRPVTALAVSRDGQWSAVARYREVVLQQQPVPQVPLQQHSKRLLEGFPGKVTALHFTPDGGRLVTASGVAGLGGVAAIWNVSDGTLIREFRGHRDILYDAELSPDGKVLATCSYDKTIQLWDAATGKPLRELAGHNGAVYDIAFSPDGEFLVSGSADDTCKVWRVRDGLRMDTLGQPLQAVYCCRFSPDGRFVVAGGADNNIRVWRFVSRDKPRINPMIQARFAHEGPILRLAFTSDGTRLVTVGEDRGIKVWDTRDYRELKVWADQPEVAMTLALAGDDRGFLVGRMDGSLADFSIPAVDSEQAASPQDSAPSVTPMEEKTDIPQVAEHEPNDQPGEANEIAVPVRITGTIHTPAEAAAGAEPAGERTSADQDLFRFTARAGEQWVLEVDAARSKSPLDSFIEVLDDNGGRLERVLLQAVRDSYFTFRGKDDSTVDDFRVFNWEEMRLDEYLYASGEVVKLWLYPRGPDSGFMVYPGQGQRWGYFDTTPLAHALGEPCYVVRPHPPGSELIPNGLPVFPLYFENDDDARRELGKDSRLTFTAPADGSYLVRIKDVRGFQGESFHYALTIRPRRPDFRVTLHGANPTVHPGGAQEFKLTAQRIDGFEGPIRVDVRDLPEGFEATTPIVIEPGQIEALGVLRARPDAPPPSVEGAKAAKVSATATIGDRQVTHEVNGLGEIKLASEPPKLKIEVLPAEGTAAQRDTDSGLLQVDIAPGETIVLKVRIERNGFDGPVAFGKEGAGRNLPYGVYVDNLGLNGLLVLQNQEERTFFVTADPIARPQSRTFHLNTGTAGGQASQPVILRVRDPRQLTDVRP